MTRVRGGSPALSVWMTFTSDPAPVYPGALGVLDFLDFARYCSAQPMSRKPAAAKWWSKANAFLIFFLFIMTKLVASTADSL
jgi:hypothetical protein